MEVMYFFLIKSGKIKQKVTINIRKDKLLK